MAPDLRSPLGPLDGRYAHQVADLADVFSEAALNKARLQVEVEWLITLTNHQVAGAKPLTADQQQALRERITAFDSSDVAALGEIEAKTQHDVKAVEYFLREILNQQGLSHLNELVHFACTSEDINNLSYAISAQKQCPGRVVARSDRAGWRPGRPRPQVGERAHAGKNSRSAGNTNNVWQRNCRFRTPVTPAVRPHQWH
jgi:hypothetical protein